MEVSGLESVGEKWRCLAQVPLVVLVCLQNYFFALIFHANGTNADDFIRGRVMIEAVDTARENQCQIVFGHEQHLQICGLRCFRHRLLERQKVDRGRYMMVAEENIVV